MRQSNIRPGAAPRKRSRPCRSKAGWPGSPPPGREALREQPGGSQNCRKKVSLPSKSAAMLIVADGASACQRAGTTEDAAEIHAGSFSAYSAAPYHLAGDGLGRLAPSSLQQRLSRLPLDALDHARRQRQLTPAALSAPTPCRQIRKAVRGRRPKPGNPPGRRFYCSGISFRP